MKRLADLLLTLPLIVILILPTIFIFILLRILYKEALFTQWRIGLNGIPFRLYKFKTLSDNLSLSEQDRVTKIGHCLRLTSLDELPQLFNILKGDMSLVGPRPLLVEYLPLLSERVAQRHCIRPGLTGLVQISGRNALSWEKRFELDLYYVKHRSWIMDCKILFVTFLKMFYPNREEFIIPEKYQGELTHEK